MTKAPGKTGLYLGLTGARLKTACTLWSGLGTHFIPSTTLPAFKRDLSRGLEEALKIHCQPLLEKGFLEKHRDAIETHFSPPSVEDIFESLSHDNSPFAKETLAVLKTKSPTSLKVVFRQLTEVASTFEERMKTEFRLSQRFVEDHDFFEGVRAVLVHKDGTPIWKPAALEQVTQETVKHYFAPLDDRELIL
ncbi:enoyl-CoA hydratase/isomerase family protein [Kamptonema cortianum]|nr:enoyl-CoA hydratase/isomerase family protein [Kamptonema cortianum]